MSRVGVAVAVATLALAVSACGGSSASISRLRAHATAICQRAAAQSDGITAPALPSQTAAFLRRGAAVLGPELAELRTLSPPSDQANEYSEALNAESRQLTTLEGTIHDLDRGADPLTVIKPLERRLAPAESADNAAWHTLDIPACVTR